MGLVSTRVASLTLWRYRFFISYVLIGLLFAGMVIMLPWLQGMRLNAAEEASSVVAMGLGRSNFGVAHLPYYVLQRLSLEVLGLTALAIKLPSIILGIASGGLIVLILNRWFKNFVALVAVALSLFSVGILRLATTGTPAISYVFWPALLFFIGSVILDRKPNAWINVAFFATAALSLYIPFMIYVLGLLLIIIVSHPHLRFSAFGMPKAHWLLGGVAATILLVPLMVGIAARPSEMGALLLPGEIDIYENMRMTLLTLVDFQGRFGIPTLTPLFQLPTFLLMLCGIVAMVTSIHRARNYTVLAGVMMALPASLIVPEVFPVIVLFGAILVADGMRYVLYRWKNIFPLNPYATTVALVPLLVLFGAIIPADFYRFFYGYRYGISLSALSNNDLALIREQLEPGDVLLVTEEEREFYRPLARELGVNVTDGSGVTLADGAGEEGGEMAAGRVFVSRAARESQSRYTVESIIVSSASVDANRFYRLAFWAPD
ncbi:glycosyltransferase family 39 protein [Candidatus Saccharibacteria bacterium]|nr:glycosyltransferase family 39 protein [Candidatus Saccharibacteria bacterium]